jgi:hypothetical protein
MGKAQHLTDAQKRALVALPGDGSWATPTVHGRIVFNLWNKTNLLLRCYDPPGRNVKYRLTPAGIAARAQIVGET